MEVYCMKAKHLHELESKVNAWLKTYSYNDVIDIKYSPIPWPSSPEYSVMIIYR